MVSATVWIAVALDPELLRLVSDYCLKKNYQENNHPFSVKLFFNYILEKKILNINYFSLIIVGFFSNKPGPIKQNTGPSTGSLEGFVSSTMK